MLVVYQVAPGQVAWDRLGTSGTVYQAQIHPPTPWPDLLADGTRIGDKPGLESCVVSQVMADTLVQLPLEGC